MQYCCRPLALILRGRVFDITEITILSNVLLQSHFLVNVLSEYFQGKFLILLSRFLKIFWSHPLMNLRSYVSLKMTFCRGSLPPWQSTIGDCHNRKELSVTQKQGIFNDAALRIRLNLLPHRSKACRELFVQESFKFRSHNTEGLPDSFRRQSACGNFSRKKKLLKNQLGTAVPPGMWFLIQQSCRPLVMLHLVCH